MQCDKTFLIGGLLLAATSLAANAIPVVPVKAVNKMGEARATKEAPVKSSVAPMVVWATPGVNQVVPVALYHLNRIVTPFESPEITTSSSVTTEIRQNVIYVGSESEAPATLFVTEKGEEGSALSLTIVPQRIPPREITIKLARQFSSITSATGKKAKRWEQSQPYVSTIRTLMRQLAQGEIPQGYALTQDDVGATLVTCTQEGLRFDFSSGQQLVGNHLAVRVGVAKNITKKPIEFNECNCANWKVAAIAAWPKSVLLPGESTEIYIAQRVSKPSDSPAKRPSLLGRNG